jgi:hypothetical protein
MKCAKKDRAEYLSEEVDEIFLNILTLNNIGVRN